MNLKLMVVCKFLKGMILNLGRGLKLYIEYCLRFSACMEYRIDSARDFHD